MQQQAGLTNLCTPWIALVLRFVVSLDTLYLQLCLNELWDRYLLGAGGYQQPAYPLPPPAPPQASIMPPSQPLTPPPPPQAPPSS